MIISTNNITELQSTSYATDRGTLVIMLTSGPEDGGKRAIVAYCTACTALSMDSDTTIFLVGDGAHWAYEGHAEGYQMNGFPTLKDLIDMYTELGGRTYICSNCDQVCGIPDETEFSNRTRRPDVLPSGLATILPEINHGNSLTF